MSRFSAPTGDRSEGHCKELLRGTIVKECNEIIVAVFVAACMRPCIQGDNPPTNKNIRINSVASSSQLGCFTSWIHEIHYEDASDVQQPHP